MVHVITTVWWIFNHICCDWTAVVYVTILWMSLSGKREGHILSKLLITMETSNILPRKVAPSHGKTTRRLRYAATCRHTAPLGSSPRKASCGNAVTWATLALNPVTRTCATLALADFEPADRTPTAVGCSGRPARVLERNPVILTPIQQSIWKYFIIQANANANDFDCIHLSRHPIKQAGGIFKVFRGIFNFTPSSFHQFKINHRREFIF